MDSQYEYPPDTRLIFRPDLNDCILEERVLLAVNNLGIIIMTTSGLALITPFPGANASGAGSLGSNGSGGGSASSVSGQPIPTSFYITGNGGLSSLKPGNITGLPSLAAAAGGAAAGNTIQVGSGADTAGGPTLNISNGGATNNVVGLFTVADPTGRPTSTVIGGTSPTSSSAVLPPGQSYRDSAPVPPPTPMGVMNQSSMGSGSTNSGGSFAPNPQLGAPRLGPFNSTRGMGSPLPGSLVPVTPMLPGNNYAQEVRSSPRCVLHRGSHFRHPAAQARGRAANRHDDRLSTHRAPACGEALTIV